MLVNWEYCTCTWCKEERYVCELEVWYHACRGSRTMCTVFVSCERVVQGVRESSEFVVKGVGGI